MGKYKRTLTTLGIWLAIQVAVGIVYLVISLFRKIDPASMLTQSLLISDILVIVALLILRYFRIKDFFKTIPADIFFISMVMGLTTMFAVDLLSQPVDVPNLLEEQFNQLAQTFGGFLGICIIGPVMEEIMMRRIILKEMRKRTHSMWWGIIISAAIFAIIHVNPIQVVFALPAGIVLGWLYCRTGSLLVPVCVHILNNTFSFITMRMDPGSESELELDSTLGIILLISAIIVAVGTTVWIVRYYSVKKEEPAILADKTGSRGAFSGDNYEK